MTVWDAEPRESRWYGEIIHDLPGDGDCTYDYGFSSQVERPSRSSLRELLPEGRKILERKIRMTQGHPRYRAPKEEDQ